jgi:hypothetical protein
MPFRCRQVFPREERCLLDHLSPFGTPAVCPSIPPFSMVTLIALRDREEEVYSVTASC